MSKEEKTLARILQNAILAKLYDVHVCLPARIEKYSAEQQKADVKPLLKKRYKGEAKDTELPVIADVPVQWPSASSGAAFLHLPLCAGDLGMVIFCERSLDAWLQGTGQIVSPGDPRHHHLSDAVFVPGVRPFGSPLDNVPGNNAVLQNGQMRIELDPAGKISIQGASSELLAILDGVLGHLISAEVETSDGPKPFTPGTISNLQSDRALLDTIRSS